MLGNIRKICIHASGMCHINCAPLVQLRHLYTPKDNSGLYRRLRRFSEDEPDIGKDNIDYNSFEELEGDFLHGEEMHDEVMREMGKISKRIQFKITERKHFRKPKEPNMLTWSEKEQIRFLHQDNPDKWTIDALSESFPATPDIIQKIIKARWKHTDAERLKLHDLRVSDNWKAFHLGKLEVHNPYLKAHLSKFTDRKDGVKVITDEEAKKITEVILPKPKRTEFLSLVTSFKPETSLVTEEVPAPLQKQITKGDEEKEMIPIPVIDSSNTNYTLDKFRQRLEDEVEKISVVPPDVTAIISQKNVNSQETSKGYVAPSERFKPDAVVYRGKSEKSALRLVDPDSHPYRIRIPKDQWKQGLVYRVNDCFYNDRGYFLYKVPGLKAD